IWVVFRYEEENTNKHPTSTRQVPDKYPTSTRQVKTLVELIGEDMFSVKELMGLMQLKDRENFLNNYLNPAIEAGLV
ncbi:Fic family protein, partial [Bacteroides ovatus]